MAMQTQLMQGMTQMIGHMQQQMGNNPPPPANGPPRDRRGDFLKGRPPFFSHAVDPMQAEDWLKAVNKQLVIA